MESLSKLIASLADLAWPAVVGILLYKLFPSVQSIVESARRRKFSLKIGDNELSMEEAAEQQSAVLTDVQKKLVEMEVKLTATHHLNLQPSAHAHAHDGVTMATLPTPRRSILWVDDNPRNNSFLIAAMKDLGMQVEMAASTDQGLSQFQSGRFDAVISDMKRGEGDKAGIAFVQAIRRLNASVPIYLFCGKWAAMRLREEALAAGATEITDSGTTLLSLLRS